MNLSEAEAEAEARRRMEQAGLIPPDALLLDGQIHRVKVAGGKPGNTDGMYHGFSDPPYNILWKNHKTGEQDKLVAGDKGLTPAQLQAASVQARANKIRRDEDLAARRAQAAAKAQGILNRSIPLLAGSAENAYLKAKGVAACPDLFALKYHQQIGEFFFGPGSLVMPIRDAAGNLATLQIINTLPNEDGKWDKRLLKYGRKESGGFLIKGETTSGRKDSPDFPAHTLLICEGLATGLSLWLATDCPVLVAIDAGNLLVASLAFRERFPAPAWTWLFCADDDWKTPSNPGLTKATEAARTIGACLAVPVFDAGRGEKDTDFNDLIAREGIETVRLYIETAIKKGPFPGKGTAHNTTDE